MGSFSDCVSCPDNASSPRSSLANVTIGGGLSMGSFSECVIRAENVSNLRMTPPNQ